MKKINRFIVSGLALGFYFLICSNSLVIASEQGGHDHPVKKSGGMLHSHHGGPPDIVMTMEPDKGFVAQKETDLVFVVRDREGKAATGLTVSHERLLHIVIISEDFSSFAHIHPEDRGPITEEMKKAARFTVRHTFPIAGRYIIAVDTAVSHEHVSKQFYVTVGGAPAAGPLKLDFSKEKLFGKYIASLQSVPVKIKAGEKALLQFTVSKDGKPVTDLERYLAAPMHLAIVRLDLDSFTHAHGDVPGSSHNHTPVGHIHASVKEMFGPEIEAAVVFPEKGRYKIFSEIKHQGKVILLDFMVEVE
jgi:hypothetical protein